MFNEVVIPLDFVRPHERGLAVASDLAHRANVPLRLVTVTSPRMNTADDLAELRAVAATTAAPSTAIQVIESNDVAESIVGAAAAGGLLVLETHARGALAAAVLGDTANGVLRRTTLPVLLVGPHADPATPPLLMDVCVDSDVADGLGRAVGPWAQHLGMRLRFVHVARPTDPAGDETLAERAARAAVDQFHVAADGVTLEGKTPAEAIVADAARVGAGIIAIALKPRPAPLRFALGSVAMAVAHATSAVVLAVPTSAARRVVAA